MKKQKLISLLLCITLFMFTFVSCKNNANTSSTTSVSTNTSTNTSKVEAPVKLVMWQQSWAKPQDDVSNTRVKEAINKALNIDINVIVAPPQGAADKLAIMLSSNEQVDIVIGNGDLEGGYKDGAVAPLNDLLNNYGQDIKKIVSADLWPLVTAKDGQILCVPNPTLGDQNYLAVREDLLKKYGMSKPTTLAEFEAYLVKMKADGLKLFLSPLDFRGTTQTSPDVFRALGGLFMADGCGDVVYKDNKVVDYIRGDGFKEMISKLNEWVAAGYIPKDIFSWTNDKCASEFSTGHIGAFVEWATIKGISPTSQAEYIDKTNKEAYFTYCDPMTGGLTGKNAGTYAVGYSGPVWITQKSQVKETAMKYLNWLLAKPDNYLLATYGVEGTDWAWVDKTTLTFKALTLPTGTEAYQGSYYYFDYYGTLLKNATAGTATKIAYKMFDQYPTHVKLVPKNPLALAEFGIFGDSAKNDNAADLVAFKSEQLVKFIVGQRGMSDWDNFITEYLKMGGQKYDDDRNAAWDAKKSTLKLG